MNHKRLWHVQNIFKSNLISKKIFVKYLDQFQQLAWAIYRLKIFKFAGISI